MRTYPLLVVLAGCGFAISPAGPPSDAAADGATAADVPLDALELACATNGAYGLSHAGSTYRFATSATLLGFDAAATLCQADDARLAVVDTVAENEHLAARVLGFGDWSWIGLTDRAVEGMHVWITGDPLLISAYQPFNGETSDPVADCYNMSPTPLSGQNGRWGNWYCDQPKGWICECDTTP